jgi:hypothetical protein
MGTEYFKHGIYSPFFSLQNAVCFIILTIWFLYIHILYTECAKIKKKNSGAKRLRRIMPSANVQRSYVLRRDSSPHHDLSTD